MTLRAALAAVLILTLPAAALAAGVPPGTALFFGIHWMDTSAEGAINGIREDETARLAMIEAQISADLSQRGFTLTAPTAEEVSKIKNPTRCNGCDTTIAAEKGLDYAITGEIQKVSNLILSMKLYIRDAKTAKTLAAGTVDIRGNSDLSWQRGYRYLFKNVLFKPEQKR